MIGLIGCGGRTDESAKDGSGLYALRGFQDAWAMVLSVQETGKQGTGSIHRICRCKSGSGRLIVRLVSGRCPCFPVFCALRTILPSLYEIPGGHTNRSHSLRIVLMMWGWLWDCGGERGWGWRNAGGSLWVGTDEFWGNAQGGCACCARFCGCVL